MKNQSRCLCVILPNNTELSLTVGLKDRGQDVFEQLFERLGTSDLTFFGLSVVKDSQPLFLDLGHKLSLYLPKSWRKNTSKEKVILSLKVQYFVENVQLILNRDTRQLYYAEVKGRVLRSECFEQEGLYFQLAAYALQADLGDCEENFAYFSPQGFFPFWIVQKHGNDYILKHTPALHRELKGMSSSEAASLFIQEAFTLSDVPLTIYRLSKEKKKTQGCVLVGVTSTGLQISEVLNGKVYDFPWPSIHSITFQGRKFDIRADGLFEKKLVLYSLSVLHAKNLLQHVRNSHRLHLNIKPLVMKLKEKNGRHREMYITDGADLVFEDSDDDDELPPMKFLVDNIQKQTTGTTESKTVTGSGASNGACCLEMSVDEPEEMLVDDPEDVLRLIELVEGVSVDGPLLLPISHWEDSDCLPAPLL
ncbi:FERM domain-containing protein 6 isoform X1 [Carassius auratus]|uniref:FERM domain-containing protein 6 isoform X1 n=1 Tax=Carassius auratus TaxID=7957 RepID=A0A6P6QG77_CARAU|nr:FERM domain-containing protein 6-like isoform X1 [Carassius auratus]XP_052427328.1 FERM domain-containing protein 6 isoform X2 [Carassius gibelio]